MAQNLVIAIQQREEDFKNLLEKFQDQLTDVEHVFYETRSFIPLRTFINGNLSEEQLTKSLKNIDCLLDVLKKSDKTIYQLTKVGKNWKKSVTDKLNQQAGLELEDTKAVEGVKNN